MRAATAAVMISLCSAPLGCAHFDTATTADTTGDYRLGTDDVVDIAVWKEPALSAAVPVRPDGKISLPMAGDVLAAGRTAAELREDVAGRLKRFIAEPMVSVMVKEVHAAHFYVLGEVTHPGGFPLTGSLTVIEAVSLAGGTTEFARKGRVTVIRRNPHGTRAMRLRVDLDDVLTGRAEPLALRAGDTVYVP